MDLRDIGPRLTAIREAKNLTLDEVAKRMGRTSSGTLAMLEQTAYLSNIETVDRFLKACGATASDLLRPELPAGSAAFDYDRVGYAIAAGRHDAGLHQAQLATKTSISKSTIEQLETGGRPRWLTLQLFWKALPQYDLLWLAWCLFRGNPIEFVARAAQVAERFDKTRVWSLPDPPPADK